MAALLATDVAPARHAAPQGGGRPPLRAPSSGEVAVAALVALAVMVAVTVATESLPLFTRRLWLDEYHTLLLVTRGGLVASMRDLAQGSDFNPPTLFLLTRVALAVVPGDDALALRLVGFASVAAAIVTTYALLRRRWGRLPATAGALALWSHRLVTQHAFEARFYGPWLAFSALFVLALVRLRERPSWARRAALAAAAVALCTIHYFGVLVWGLVVAADVLSQPRVPLARRSTSWPALAGPLALAACMPIYLGQKAALSVATWMDPLTLRGTETFLAELYVWKPMVAVAGLAAASWLLGRLAGGRWARRLGAAPAVRPVDARTDVATRALVLVGALPLALLAFSLAVQPVALSRYGIPAVLALAPVVALLTAAALEPLQVLIVGLLLLRSMTVVQRAGWEARDFDGRIARMSEDIRAHAKPGETVLVAQRHYLYPLAHDSSMRAIPLRLPQYSDSTRLDAYGTVERDVARVHNRLYGFPRLQPVSALRGAPRLLVADGPDGRRPQLDSLYPGYRVRKLTRSLSELTPDVASDSERRAGAAPLGRIARGSP